MKTSVSKLIKTSLAVAIVATVVACNPTKTDTSKPATATAVPEKAEIVYVNSDTLVHNYEYAKDMAKRLQDKGKSANDDVISKKQAFQREVGDYQKGAQTMSADQRASTEQRLGRKQQELQTYEQNANAQFQNESASEQSKLYDKIADFAKQYAKEKGYKLVLTYSKANPTVLFGDPSLDVTQDVVKRLNDLYAKDKK
ncbi:periplasmic chaperone for outer membrane proteins Skp [Mucilaginibacter gracilis]|uniref:Periplasmic chaperone for outer membrane proteins Skp n=1 Tax=Mucilaginibacter gracilis TaxID=423350 RepID=A0A495J0Y7_9SPHI|nr:OmpH family outer membrane protein [Mucilaginibacter gracilis]RKR82281.1 periplasmic chaperone for outer membrane proteins Skp [Mucilaginibacter gracilis]